MLKGLVKDASGDFLDDKSSIKVQVHRGVPEYLLAFLSMNFNDANAKGRITSRLDTLLVLSSMWSNALKGESPPNTGKAFMEWCSKGGWAPKGSKTEIKAIGQLLNSVRTCVEYTGEGSTRTGAATPKAKLEHESKNLDDFHLLLRELSALTEEDNVPLRTREMLPSYRTLAPMFAQGGPEEHSVVLHELRAIWRGTNRPIALESVQALICALPTKVAWCKWIGENGPSLVDESDKTLTSVSAAREMVYKMKLKDGADANQFRDPQDLEHEDLTNVVDAWLAAPKGAAWLEAKAGEVSEEAFSRARTIDVEVDVTSIDDRMVVVPPDLVFDELSLPCKAKEKLGSELLEIFNLDVETHKSARRAAKSRQVAFAKLEACKLAAARQAAVIEEVTVDTVKFLDRVIGERLDVVILPISKKLAKATDWTKWLDEEEVKREKMAAEVLTGGPLSWSFPPAAWEVLNKAAVALEATDLFVLGPDSAGYGSLHGALIKKAMIPGVLMFGPAAHVRAARLISDLPSYRIIHSMAINVVRTADRVVNSSAFHECGSQSVVLLGRLGLAANLAKHWDRDAATGHRGGVLFKDTKQIVTTPSVNGRPPVAFTFLDTASTCSGQEKKRSVLDEELDGVYDMLTVNALELLGGDLQAAHAVEQQASQAMDEKYAAVSHEANAFHESVGVREGLVGVTNRPLVLAPSYWGLKASELQRRKILRGFSLACDEIAEYGREVSSAFEKSKAALDDGVAGVTGSLIHDTVILGTDLTGTGTDIDAFCPKPQDKTTFDYVEARASKAHTKTKDGPYKWDSIGQGLFAKKKLKRFFPLKMATWLMPEHGHKPYARFSLNPAEVFRLEEKIGRLPVERGLVVGLQDTSLANFCNDPVNLILADGTPAKANAQLSQSDEEIFDFYLVMLRDVEEGEEIFVSYGSEFWGGICGKANFTVLDTKKAVSKNDADDSDSDAAQEEMLPLPAGLKGAGKAPPAAMKTTTPVATKKTTPVSAKKQKLDKAKASKKRKSAQLGRSFKVENPKKQKTDASSKKRKTPVRTKKPAKKSVSSESDRETSYSGGDDEGDEGDEGDEESYASAEESAGSSDTDDYEPEKVKGSGSNSTSTPRATRRTRGAQPTAGHARAPSSPGVAMRKKK